MEMKPAFAEATAGHESEMFKISKGMLATPDTTMGDFILAEQAAERLKDGLAEYFQRYDALLCPVLRIPAHAHGLSEIVKTRARTSFVGSRDARRVEIPVLIDADRQTK